LENLVSTKGYWRIIEPICKHYENHGTTNASILMEGKAEGSRKCGVHIGVLTSKMLKDPPQKKTQWYDSKHPDGSSYIFHPKKKKFIRTKNKKQ
jgi:hypothetical protein